MTENCKNDLSVKILSERQKKILKYIIESHTENPEAVASNQLKEKVLNEVSSATIRNELVSLEKAGFLTKEHSSSGRIPTKMGYQYYVNNLMDETTSEEFQKIHNEINQLFKKRLDSIDETIDSTVKILEKFVELPIVIAKVADDNELLKRIDIVEIVANQYMLFLITSYTNVIKHFFEIENKNQYQDIAACIKIFNEKLINVPVNQITQQIEQLTDLIRSKVHEYEFVFQHIINQLILKVEANYRNSKPKVYNMRSLINKPEVQNNNINLEKIMEILEKTSIFDQINFNHERIGKTLINFDNSVEGLSIAATEIEDASGMRHQIGFLGPVRMDYKLLNQILGFLGEKLSGKEVKKRSIHEKK